MADRQNPNGSPPERGGNQSGTPPDRQYKRPEGRSRHGRRRHGRPGGGGGSRTDSRPPGAAAPRADIGPRPPHQAPRRDGGNRPDSRGSGDDGARQPAQSRPEQRFVPENRPRVTLKLDSHQHFWRYSATEYTWIGGSQVRLQRDYLPDELLGTVRQAGVDGSIAVQARQSVEETDMLLELAGRWEFIRGVVGWVPLAADNIGEHLERYSANPKFRGVRHVVQDEPEEDFLLQPAFNRGIDKLIPYGLAYDILVYERQLPKVVEFVDRHPYQTFVLDHSGKPRISEGSFDSWRASMQEIADRINVYCKVSGLVTEAHSGNWKPEEIIPYIDTVFDLFGPERVMFGSDWPVCLQETEYANWVGICAGYVSSYSQSEQRRFWSESAREAYRL